MGGLSLIVGAVALVPATLAVVLRARVPGVVTAGLAHVAGTGFLVALAASDRLAPYTTALLQKRADGSIAPLSRALFWPYHLGLQAKLMVQRRRSAEPLYNQLAAQPRLYIGGWPETAARLPQRSPPVSIVDVTCELPRTAFGHHHSQQQQHRYLNLPVWDTQAPSPAQISQAVDWSLRELADGREVYVHCAHGHGRSATVLAAVCIASGLAATADEAVSLMRASRPRVRLNRPQAAALRAWISQRGGEASSSKGGGGGGGGVCDADVIVENGGGGAAVAAAAAGAASSKR